MAFGYSSSHQRVSQAAGFVAPLGGINDLDPIAAMDPTFCLSMINWYPGTTSVRSRAGYREWAINLSGTVRRLIPYKALDGSSQLLATTDTGLYNVSMSGDAPTLMTAISNGDLDYAQFATVAGNWLVLVNSTDSGWVYDGTTLTPMTQTSPATTPGQIEGVNPNRLFSVTTFKRRLWFAEEDTLTAWYLDTDAIAGTATPFYLGSVFKKGGYIKYVVPWSMDAGEDIEDRLMFVSSTGELAIYAGTDPNSATDWKLQAVYEVPAPVGVKSYAELGGDILLLTRSGIIPLSRVVNGQANAAIFESSLSKRISTIINTLFRISGSSDRWQLGNALSSQAIVIVMPPISPTPGRQYVMNVVTGAWTQFDVQATCFTEFKGDIYFGDESGRVLRFGDVFKDDIKLDGSGGVPIQCSLFTAYSDLGASGTLKHFKMIRPIFQGAHTPSFKIAVNVDYSLSPLAGAPANPGAASAFYLWDSAFWDDAFWSSSATVSRPWCGIQGLGYTVAMLLKAATIERTQLAGGQILYEPADGI